VSDEFEALELSQEQLAELERNPGPRRKKKPKRPTRDDQPRDELGRWALKKKVVSRQSGESSVVSRQSTAEN
jgi:hypothetical protein